MHFAVAEIAQAYKRGRIGHDEFRAAQSHKGDEHSDTAGGGVLQAFRDAVYDLFADACDGQEHKQDTGKKDGAQRHGPRHMHSEADRVGEIGVQRHSRGQCNGIIRIQAHHQRRDGRGKAGGKDHAVWRHARLRQNLRIDDHNVGHREERGHTTQDFLPHRGLILFELKQFFDQCGRPPPFVWLSLGDATVGASDREVNVTHASPYRGLAV